MNIVYGLLVSLIAGVSTLIGYLFIYIKGDSKKIIVNSLSFAGGVMISLSLIDLLPTGLNNLNNTFNYTLSIIISLIFFFIGFFISYFISTLVKEDNSKLYKTGLIAAIGIVLHNIPEGIAVFTVSAFDLKLGILLAVAIILHNIPEGISVSIPIYHSTKSKKKAFLYTFISGISEPIGALLAYMFLYKYINNSIIGILFSFIAGLMIYIGYFELLKTSFYYNNKKNTIMYSIVGIIFIIFVELLLKMQ